MSTMSLEDRVAILENKVELLFARPAVGDNRPAWERALDRLPDSDILRAINQAALAYREEDRQKFRGQQQAAGEDSE